ncbi:guanylate kinase [Candidatus Dependentiae bacterium]|nr:guanylate kinase [Candidatus Dependentiae bacterium]
MFATGRLFIISAPTGGGKTTIAKRAFQALEKIVPLEKVITYTTRQPRLNERNGIDYHFVDLADFKTKEASGFFLETTFYDNNFYGCPRNILDTIAKGKSFILVADRAGAKTIKQLYPQAILIWFDVPSLNVLEERLQKRGRETGEALHRRITIAAEEITEEERNPIFDFHLCNDDLNTATTELIQLIEASLTNS